MTSKINENLELLHQKFGDNLQLCLSEKIITLEEVEVKARAICILGDCIKNDTKISETQSEISKIYSEIFTDLTISIYLGCCAIDNAPKILLRRVLELGIATVYLWDLPYKYWSWKKYDDHSNDLNFSEMLDYLNNAGYIDFINRENDTSLSDLVNKSSINRIYRELSNVIHGKSENFESSDPDRFTHSISDLTDILSFAKSIENILLTLWKKRFPAYVSQMEERLLAITKYSYEQ